MSTRGIRVEVHWRMFSSLRRTNFSKMLLAIAAAGVQDRKPKIFR
jgi:hypothetical protein